MPKFHKKTKKKTQKPKKTSFPKLWGWCRQKMVLWFSGEKDGFFGSKPSFSREKDGFWRSSPGKTIFFSKKKMVFRRMVAQNHLFLEKKYGFEPKTQKKTSFSRENQKKTKKNKKPSVPKLWGWGLQKMVFCFCFLEKKMVFWFETIFFSKQRRF